MKVPENIIISRIDNIGDVVLAMPVAGALKKYFPGIKIAFLGRSYTRDIAMACSHVDEFITVEDFFCSEILIDGKMPVAIVHLITNQWIAGLASKLNIPTRIGTGGRLYHWFTCNKIVMVSRKRSPLHEAQLNLKLLSPLGIKQLFSLKEIEQLYGLSRLQPLSAQNAAYLKKNKFNIIIHPKSQGKSREWPLDHFVTLINMLDAEEYNIILSGVEKEKPFIEKIVQKISKPVIVIAGQMALGQLISFINAADALVANSTGPVHIAAALGKDTIGLYPPIRPKHPGRWGPVGVRAQVFVFDKSCNDCRGADNDCSCIKAIEPLSVKMAIDKLMIAKNMHTNALIS